MTKQWLLAIGKVEKYCKEMLVGSTKNSRDDMKKTYAFFNSTDMGMMKKKQPYFKAVYFIFLAWQ